MALWRLKSNSNFDDSFGNLGMLIFRQGPHSRSFVIDKDSKDIFVSGNFRNGTNLKGIVWKVDKEGVIDQSFAKQGKFIMPEISEHEVSVLFSDMLVDKEYTNIYLTGLYEQDLFVIKFDKYKGMVNKDYFEGFYRFDGFAHRYDKGNALCLSKDSLLIAGIRMTLGVKQVFCFFKLSNETKTTRDLQWPILQRASSRRWHKGGPVWSQHSW
jgi:hypothetical protein